MSMNISSMSGMVSGCVGMIDYEHQRIIRALQAYGVEPTGDKSMDKAKLQRIQAAESSKDAKMSNDTKDESKSAKDIADGATTIQKNEGAEQLAMLNRMQLGLL